MGISKDLTEEDIPIAIVEMDDVDDFDFICHIAYGKKTLTRHERAEQVKKREIMKLIRHRQRYSVYWGLR